MKTLAIPHSTAVLPEVHRGTLARHRFKPHLFQVAYNYIFTILQVI